MDFPAVINDNDCVPAQRAGSGSIFDPKFYDQKTSSHRVGDRPVPGQ